MIAARVDTGINSIVAADLENVVEGSNGFDRLSDLFAVTQPRDRKVECMPRTLRAALRSLACVTWCSADPSIA